MPHLQIRTHQKAAAGGGNDVIIPESPYMTMQEVWTYLRITRGTLYRIIKRGDLECYKIGGRYRITREAVHRYMSKHHGGPSTQWDFTK